MVTTVVYLRKYRLFNNTKVPLLLSYPKEDIGETEKRKLQLEMKGEISFEPLDVAIDATLTIGYMVAFCRSLSVTHRTGETIQRLVKETSRLAKHGIFIDYPCSEAKAM